MSEGITWQFGTISDKNKCHHLTSFITFTMTENISTHIYEKQTYPKLTYLIN